MTDELKIRVHDYKRVETELLRRGAVFREERQIVDTYFNQPVPHEVLKIQRDQHNNWLVYLKPRDGKFEVVKFEKLADADGLHAELEAKFGIMSVLTKRCLFYDWGAYFLDFNLIEDFGEFLVITGEAPTVEMLAELGVDNPERVTVPFNELPRTGYRLA
jgi:adenylate cyclase class IV